MVRYYYSEIKPDKAAIALSDFTYDGYQMSKSMVNLSLEHILLSGIYVNHFTINLYRQFYAIENVHNYIVSALGNFHGAAYGLKQTNPTEFNSINDKFRESRYKHAETQEQWDRRLRIGPKRCTKAMRNAVGGSPVPEEFLVRLEDVLENTYNYQKHMVQPVEPLAVFCHGDYLRNNIAYKYADDAVSSFGKLLILSKNVNLTK